MWNKQFAVVLFVVLAVSGCKETGSKKTTNPVAIRDNTIFESIVSRLARQVARDPLNYGDLQNWACSSEFEFDTCNTTEGAAVVASDLSVTYEQWSEPVSQPVDCFYIYPTVNPNLLPGNVDDSYQVIPNLVIQAQAARFSQACRVFAPYYRQANGGSYITGGPLEQLAFKRAFLDVAAAFEFYLRHYNQGRPVIIIGHSQGAQHASYLLRLYFDGTGQVTDIPGSENAEDLRRRLVVALPIGFNVYTRVGETAGGSFETIPVCTLFQETGCVISYRTYAEGLPFGPSWLFAALVDQALAAEGFMYQTYESGVHELACVNPSFNSLGASYRALNNIGLPVEDGDIRVLEGTYLPYSFNVTTSSFETGREYLAFPNRYTATCRHDFAGNQYLAIGFNEPPLIQQIVDMRGDVYAIRVQPIIPLGLHLIDFNVALDDLVRQVKTKVDYYTSPSL